MDKQQILSFIKSQVDGGKVTVDEISAALGNTPVQTAASVSVQKPETSSFESRKLVNVFYALGMIIAIVGVVILIAQNWSEIGFIGRVLVTLGISTATYLAGILARGDEHSVLSQVMFTISAALAPIGVFVVMSEAHIDITIDTHIIISAALTVLYGVAQFVARRNILTIIITFFATSVYFTLLIKMFDRNLDDIMQWAIIVLGFAYIFLSEGIKKDAHDPSYNENKSVVKLLSSLGTICILGSGITLGGFWDMVYILPLFGAFYASVFLRNSSMLVVGALFLMAHIVKLTSEYFVDSIGWPVALVFCGFVIIGIGYMTLQLNKKYIKSA